MSSPTTFDKYTTQVTALVHINHVKKDHSSYFQIQVKIYLVQKFTKEFMNKEKKKFAKKSPTERHSMTIKQTKLVTLSIATSQFLAFFTLLRATS